MFCSSTLHFPSFASIPMKEMLTTSFQTALTTLTRHRRHTKTLCIAGASHQGRSSTFVCLGGLMGRTGRTSMPIPSMIGTYPLFPSGRCTSRTMPETKLLWQVLPLHHWPRTMMHNLLCPAVPRRTVQYHRHTNHVLLLYRESQRLACNSNARQNESRTKDDTGGLAGTGQRL
jgi:hypothetical protein